MNSLVVYGSRHGNTHKVAEAIAFELGKHAVARWLWTTLVRCFPSH